MNRPEKTLLVSLGGALAIAVGAALYFGTSLFRGAPDGDGSAPAAPVARGAADGASPVAPSAPGSDAVSPAADAAPAAPGGATGGASIAGRAVDRRDRTGVPRVAVFLEKGESRGFGDFQAKAPAVPPRGSLRADTDASGAFRLEGVAPGTYQVFAASDAWYCPTPKVVVVGEGEEKTGVEVEVARAGAVSGLVTDRHGAPIAGATVESAPGFESLVLLQQSRNLGRAGRRETTTDPGGLFEIAGLPEGRGYRLSAAKPGFAPGAKTNVAVKAGEETRFVNVVLLKGGSLRGTVTGPDGAPVAGVEARLNPIATADWFGGDAARVSAKTDEAGRFALDAVPPGKRRLAVDAAGFVPYASEPIEFEDEKEAPALAVKLEAGVTIAGRVLDAAGAPIEGASVTASSANRRGGPPASRKATSDATGAYVVRGLAPDATFFVNATAPDHEVASRTGVPGGAESIDFTLKRNAGISGVVQRPDGSPMSARFSVRATATGGPAFPFGGGGGNGPGGFGGRSQREESFTDAEGRFFLKGVRAGGANVVAKAEGFADAEPLAVDVPAEGVAENVGLTLKEAGGITGVVLRASDRTPVEGARVRDGKPDPGFGEFFASAFAPGSQETPLDGTFTLAGLAPGTHSVSVSHAEFPTVTVDEILVPAGPPVGPIEILVDAGGGVFGTVFGADGRPEPGAVVAVMAGLMNVKRTAIADDAGAYEIRGLAPGGYSLLKTKMSTENPFEGMRTVAVTIVAGEMTRVDLGDALGGCRVFGTVTDAGAPVDGANVTTFLRAAASADSSSAASPDDGGVAGGMQFRTTRTDKAGAYEIANLPPGEYRFQIQPGGDAGRPFVVDAFVPSEPEARIDFTVPRGGFAGRVFDADTGQPIVGVSVTAALSESARRGDFSDFAGRDLGSAVTDRDGKFEFDRLAPGVYRAEAGGAGGFPGADSDVRYGRDVREGIGVEEGKTTRGIDFALRAAGALSALVLGPDGKPVAGAFLHLRDSQGNEVSGFGNVSNAEGRVRVAGLKPDAYRVTALSLQFAPLVRDGVRILSASDTEEEFRLVVGGGVELTVTDRGSGRPVAGARADLLDGEGRPVLRDARLLALFTNAGRDTTDANGLLSVRHVPPGTYRLRVAAPGREPAEKAISVADGESLDVEVRVD